MTEYIEQTSASDRYEAARKIIAAHDAAVDAYADATNLDEAMAAEARMENATSDAVKALRALITPPSVGESEHEMALEIAKAYWPTARGTAYEAAVRGIRAGIQYAHERWEPADHPSQEQMLRWLGLEYTEHAYGGVTDLIIEEQSIEKEEI